MFSDCISAKGPQCRAAAASRAPPHLQVAQVWPAFLFEPRLNLIPAINFFFQFGWNQPQEIGSMITASSRKKDNGQISPVGVGVCSAITMSH